MRKSHVKLFFYFSTALLALSVLGAGVSYGQVPQKEKASNATAQASTKSAATNAKVDLNTASEKDLESLPGVGSATAKKITAGRPYSSVDDLSKAGVSAGTIKKIAPLVMVSGGSAAAASTKAATPASHPSPAAPSQPASTSPPAKKVSTSSSQGSPGAGMVWVNLNSKVYHMEGDRYYGKTKNGKYMTLEEAKKAGYREAKSGGKPKD